MNAERSEQPSWGVFVFLLTVSTAAGCAGLVRPEGDGGWSPDRRNRELARLAESAGTRFADVERVNEWAFPGRPIDLEDALSLARTRNRWIVEARHSLEEAKKRVDETQAVLLPSTRGSGRYTRYTDRLRNSIEFPPELQAQGIGSRSFTVRDEEALTLNGTIEVVLDLSGELRYALRAAQAGYRGEKARAWAAELGEQVRVIRAYFQLLEAGRLREVTKRRIEVQAEQLANARSRFESGRLTRNQLLVVEVALRNSRQELLRRDIALDEARWVLNRATGLPVDAPTEIVDVEDVPELAPVGEMLRLARDHNPPLAGLLEEQQRLEATITSLERSRLPRFTGGGAIDYTSSDIVLPQEIGSGFVGFRWDIGTDGGREARIARTRIEAKQNRVAIERELRELESSVRSVRSRVHERIAALEAARQGVAQAEENLRIRRQQFQTGRATSEDVLDAEALLAGQRAEAASALYRAHVRRAELQGFIGLPADSLVPGEGETR